MEPFCPHPGSANGGKLMKRFGVPSRQFLDSTSLPESDMPLLARLNKIHAVLSS